MSAELSATRSERSLIARNLSSASEKPSPVALFNPPTTILPNWGLVLMPVPTAVPPMGSSLTYLRAAETRRASWENASA